MAVLFVLLLLLLASGGGAGGEHGAGLSQLTLHGIEDSGRGRASDAPPQGQGQGLMVDHLLLRHGCGAFAGLLAATANATEIFREHAAAAAGTGGRLTVFCPNNLAVAAFEAKFNNLSVDDQLAVVLFHGVTAHNWTEQITASDPICVSTLAADAATNCPLLAVIAYHEGAVWVWPASRGNGSWGMARVTTEVASGEPTLAVYVIDRVLLPRELRQRVEGGDEEAAARTLYGRVYSYLGWLPSTVPSRAELFMAFVTGILGSMAGSLMSNYFCGRRKLVVNQ